jgi:hypothetical protein
MKPKLNFFKEKIANDDKYEIEKKYKIKQLVPPLEETEKYTHCGLVQKYYFSFNTLYHTPSWSPV